MVSLIDLGHASPNFRINSSGQARSHLDPLNFQFESSGLLIAEQDTQAGYGVCCQGLILNDLPKGSGNELVERELHFYPLILFSLERRSV